MSEEGGSWKLEAGRRKTDGRPMTEDRRVQSLKIVDMGQKTEDG
jgi:hypothetical protein